jgi:hypothetical protein
MVAFEVRPELQQRDVVEVAVADPAHLGAGGLDTRNSVRNWTVASSRWLVWAVAL